MIEVALTMPIYMALVLTLIDLAWAAFVQIMINLAAQQAIDCALTQPMETDTSCSSGVSIAQRQTERQNYLRAVQSVLGLSATTNCRAAQTARLVASTDPSSAVKLVMFSHYDPSRYPTHGTCLNSDAPGSGVALPYVSPIALIRPGERVDTDLPSSPIRDYDSGRPFGPGYTDADWTTGIGWPGVDGPQPNDGNESWEGVLANQPVAALVEVIFDPISPWFDSFTLQGAALGYRDSARFGSGSPQPGGNSCAVPECQNPQQWGHCSICISRGCYDCSSNPRCQDLCQQTVLRNCSPVTGNFTDCQNAINECNVQQNCGVIEPPPPTGGGGPTSEFCAVCTSLNICSGSCSICCSGSSSSSGN
ncbi:MAG: hypothetical protein DCC75_00130 [Proteobacteria bacterium]|nr:MAG: hypothetical protein DCC75_00130 [Pseudomonadota bacterium]